MEAGIARQNAAQAKAEGNEEEALKQTELELLKVLSLLWKKRQIKITAALST